MLTLLMLSSVSFGLLELAEFVIEIVMLGKLAHVVSFDWCANSANEMTHIA